MIENYTMSNLLNLFINNMSIEEALAKFRCPLDMLVQVHVTEDFFDFNFYQDDLVLIDTRFDKITEEGVYALKQGDKTNFIRVQILLTGRILVQSKEGIFAYEEYCSEINRSFRIDGKVLPYKFGRMENLQ